MFVSKQDFKNLARFVCPISGLSLQLWFEPPAVLSQQPMWGVSEIRGCRTLLGSSFFGESYSFGGTFPAGSLVLVKPHFYPKP